jgi:hypothetical protein
MVTINQVKTEIVYNKDGSRLSFSDLIDGEEVLIKKAAKLLGIGNGDIKSISILKHSIDARKKPLLYNVYTLGVEFKNGVSESNIVKKCRNNNIAIANNHGYYNYGYIFPKQGTEKLDNPPVIIGMGPAGLFCGYMLAKHGYKPIILERGYDVETRTRDVEEYWNGGKLNPESNVQFGEGGAGTFSDGKLNTLVKDKNGRNKEVLRIFTEFGAPKHILYENKPHIGTDILKTVVANMRKYIIEQGGQVRFGAKVTGFEINNGNLTGVYVNNNELVRTSQAVLAIGHSARDTFEVLDKLKVSMEAKSFAVGMRVEHPQSVINEAMYGAEHGGKLPAAPYKLTAQTKNGRGVYSFCMCPGGYVVNASSEEGRIAVNGMSYSDRGSDNANSAIIVQVTPEDFGGKGALAGVYFQRGLEEKAYRLGNGKIPVQYFGDYINNVSSKDMESRNGDLLNQRLYPCIKGGYEFTNLRGLLPDECEKSFIEAFGKFDKTIKGFADRGAVLSGIESRTSSPIRINRNEDLQSPSVKGLYPCGEGAGYAGGITSAAMDGIVVAEKIAGRFTEKYQKSDKTT